jgi:hypothetical protein
MIALFTQLSLRHLPKKVNPIREQVFDSCHSGRRCADFRSLRRY